MSRLLARSCCALACVCAFITSTSPCHAQGKQVSLRMSSVPHQPVYDYVPVGASSTQGLGYCGPVNCSANCGPGCTTCSDGGDCGCGGCDGSCGCGPGACNCGAGGCNCGSGGCGCCGDCGSDCAGRCDCSDMGCTSCDMGCGPCDGYCDSDCGVAYECVPECCSPRFTMFGEFLYLQVTDADVTHAQQQDGLGGPGTVPFGEIGSIGQDFNPGFRVGGSVACGPCTSVIVSYTFFESDSFSSLAPPFSTSTGAVGSLVQHPGAGLTASTGPVNATYDVDFQLGDVMWRRIVHQTCRYELAFSAGAEYGHLEQQLLTERNLRRRCGRRDRHVDRDHVRRRRHQVRRRRQSPIWTWLWNLRPRYGRRTHRPLQQPLRDV